MVRGMVPKLRKNWIDWFARLAELARRDAAARSAPPASVPAAQVVKAAVEARLATQSPL
jgi:hypothetical protein